MGDWYLGEIRNFAFGKIPMDWMPCDGRTLPVNQYNALFSLLSNMYGGDGRTTFALPDLRGRVAVNRGQSPAGSTYVQGKNGGPENVTLTVAQLPAHNHQLAGKKGGGTIKEIANNFISSVGTSAAVPTQQNALAAPGSGMIPLNPGSVQNTGSGGAHSNMQPFSVTSFCIATVGLYPMRP